MWCVRSVYSKSCLTHTHTHTHTRSLTHTHTLALTQIEHMVEKVAEFTIDAPEMLVALRAIAKLEDLNIPLQRNQNIIMKAVTLHRAVVVDAALIDDRSDPDINRERMAMLRRETGGDRDASMLRTFVLPSPPPPHTHTHTHTPPPPPPPLPRSTRVSPGCDSNAAMLALCCSSPAMRSNACV
jgi:hypothetical protein